MSDHEETRRCVLCGVCTTRVLMYKQRVLFVCNGCVVHEGCPPALVHDMGMSGNGDQMSYLSVLSGLTGACVLVNVHARRFSQTFLVRYADTPDDACHVPPFMQLELGVRLNGDTLSTVDLTPYTSSVSTSAIMVLRFLGYLRPHAPTDGADVCAELYCIQREYGVCTFSVQDMWYLPRVGASVIGTVMLRIRD